MEKKFHTIKQKQNGLMPQNLKATYCENNNTGNYREFWTIFARHLEMYLNSSARLHFHSASPYIVDKSLIPMGVSRS